MFRRFRWFLVGIGFSHWLWFGRVGVPAPGWLTRRWPDVSDPPTDWKSPGDLLEEWVP